MVRVLHWWPTARATTLDAVFGTERTDELGYAQYLLRSTRAVTIVLADRNFAAANWIAAL